MSLDTFLIVSRIEFVVFVWFLCYFWGRLIRGSRAGESQFKTASCPDVGSRGSVMNCLLCPSTSSSRLFREQSVCLAHGEPSSA